MREQDPDASFNVVVVDSRPLLEGEKLLKVLTAAGLPCTYILLPLLSSILPQADLVLLGASALHSDGALYSRAGTAVVAMLAKEHRVPVVACVETYKFGERVVLDGVATNELGDVEGLLTLPTNKPFALVKEGKPLPSNLTPLHVVYDVTPPSLITAVCTEASLSMPFLFLYRLLTSTFRLVSFPQALCQPSLVNPVALCDEIPFIIIIHHCTV